MVVNKSKVAQLLIAVGLLTLLGSTVANSSTTIGDFSSSFMSSKQNEITRLKHEVKKTKVSYSKDLEVGSKVIQETTKELASVKSEVKKLSKEVDKLDDMFVRVDRYAPDAAGNAYAPGNCTFGVKQWRPDIGNYWGDAKHWYDNAKSQGWNVGDTPKKNAIGVSQDGYYGHVFLVVGISDNGDTIRLREMNYSGLWSVGERVVSSSGFRYIYELN